jgi:hypothetical protein
MEYELKLYIVNLESYNNLSRHGVWLDFNGDIEEWKKAIIEMMRSAPFHNDKFEIIEHGYWGDSIKNVKRSGSLDNLEQFLQTYHDIAMGLETYGVAYELALANNGSHSEALKTCKGGFQGEFKNLNDWLYDHVADLPDFQKASQLMRDHFDYGSYVTTLEANTSFWYEWKNGMCYVFF